MASVNRALLDVRDLSVAFGRGGEMIAADRVSFRIGKGETVALVGESGSGKTVSALSILKLLPYPAASHPSGEVWFEGKDLLKLKPSQLQTVRGNRISMIFQEPMTSLNPLHTIQRQVGEVLRVHRRMDENAVRARVLELLQKVGIREPEKRLDAFPHQLSGGQRQRVMIAMALANEPDLLIADEPTTALDVTIQAQILELLKQLQREMGMAHAAHHPRPRHRPQDGRARLHHAGRQDRRGRRHRGYLHQAAARLYEAAAGGRAEGRSAGRQRRGTRRRRDRRPEGVVPHQEGRHAPHGRLREGRRRAVAQAAQGPDARRRRRVRFRQDHFGPRHPAADLLARADRLCRQAHRRADQPRDASAAQGNADRLPGSVRLAVAAHVGQPDHRRRPDHPGARARLRRSAACASVQR